MADDNERLVVLLEARVADAQRAWERAEKRITGSHQGMRRSSKTATDAMEKDMQSFSGRIGRLVDSASNKFGGMGKAFVGGFLGGLTAGGISAIVSRVGAVADEVARIGDEAQRAGLGIKAFQELKYVAEQNRVGVDALVDGIKELNLRADEWIVTGGGSAAEAFKRLGFGATELRDKLQDPSKLFTEIIGKLQQLDRAAQIRIADEIFGGTGGEQFVQLIQQGEDGIARTIDEANRLGLVLDAEVIAKADEVDRKFNQWATTLSQSVKGAVVEVADAMAGFLDGFGTPQHELELLEARAAGLTGEIEQLTIAASNAFPTMEEDLRRVIVELLNGKTGAEQAKAALLAMAKDSPDFAPIVGDLNGLISVLALVTGQAREAKIAIAAMTSDPIGNGASWDAFQGTFFPKPVKQPKTGGGRSSAEREAERQAKAIQNVVSALQFELAVMGVSDLEREKMNRLRQAGVDAASEEGKKISALVDQLHAQQKAMDASAEAAKEYQAQFDAVVGTLGDAIGQVFSGGIENAEDFFATVMNGFAELGRTNITSGLGNLMNGTGFGGGAPSGGQQGNGFWGSAIFDLPGAVEAGAKAGTKEGGAAGIFAALKSGGAVGIGLGGLGMGYQSANPLMGGLGGALQGFMAGSAAGGIGGPLGAVVGGAAGPVGPLFPPRPQNDNQDKERIAA